MSRNCKQGEHNKHTRYILHRITKREGLTNKTAEKGKKKTT